MTDRSRVDRALGRDDAYVLTLAAMEDVNNWADFARLRTFLRGQLAAAREVHTRDLAVEAHTATDPLCCYHQPPATDAELSTFDAARGVACETCRPPAPTDGAAFRAFFEGLPR